jgi:hypothetical protein
MEKSYHQEEENNNLEAILEQRHKKSLTLL